jgi:VWFA-related protein
MLSFGALAGAVAQPPGTSDGLVLGETIDVRVVNVEVVVTDKDGNRVYGLGADDFRLFVDGQPASVDYFSEIAEGGSRAASEGTSADPPELAAPIVRPGSPVRTSHLVFIDNLFSVQSKRDEVLTSLQAELRQLRPGDQVAVVSFDGQRLDLECDWTSDSAIVTEALERAKQRRSLGFHRLAELRQSDDLRKSERDMVQMIEALMSEESEDEEDAERFEFLKNFTVERAGQTEADFAHLLADQVRRASLGAAAAMRSLAHADGRKTVLLLSGGWPASQLEYVVADGKQSIALTLDAAISQAAAVSKGPLDPLIDAANRLAYTLYPIDVPGLVRKDTIEIGAATDTFFAIQQGEVEDAANPRREREAFQHDTLLDLAWQTGGAALLNAARERALPLVAADTRDFYWLGFTPAASDDDRRHSIQVEVLRPGLEARARTSFLDLSPDAEAQMKVEMALLFDNTLDATPLELIFGEPASVKRKSIEIPLDVRIPLDGVTVVEQQGTFIAQVDVRISVIDEAGNTESSTADTVAIRGSQRPAPGQYFTYTTMLALRNRDQKLVVGVYDTVSNSVLAGSARFVAAEHGGR